MRMMRAPKSQHGSPTLNQEILDVDDVSSKSAGHRVARAGFTLLSSTLGCEPHDPTDTRAGALGSANLVISQVYGGGGNSGSIYKNDFIEIFNRGTTTVSVGGWSVQYASATGSSWSVTALSGHGSAGAHYLVAESRGTGGTTAFPRRTPAARSA